MIRYLLKRLVSMIPTLLGITLITFFVITLAPGDPVQATFQTGGSGAGDESGSGDADRLADAIKAKQQLLGMMAEDRTLLSWSGGTTNADGVAPWHHKRFVDLGGAWARDLEVVGDTLWIGDDTGRVTAVAKDGTTQRGFTAHTESIWALAATDTLVVTADKKGEIALFQPDGTEIARIPGSGKPIRDVAIAGDKIYAATDKGPIRELSAEHGRLIREFTHHVGATYAVAVVGDRLFSGGTDRQLRTLDLGSGEEVGEPVTHGGAINAIVPSADGKWLATAADDRKVRRIPLSAGTLGESEVYEGHYKQVTSVAISADGSQLVSGSRDELIRVWNVADQTSTGIAATTTGRFHDVVFVDGTPVAAGDFWYKVPVYKRYFKWLGRTVTLDFGRSFIDDERVIDKIAKALPVTLGLNFIAILIIYGISVPLGIFAAVKRGQTFDNVSSVVLFVLYSVPNFWLATMLIMFLSSANYWNIFPSGRLHSPDEMDMAYFAWLWDWGWHLVLPITVMVYAGFASLSRYVRTSMLEALAQDYVRTARAKGLSEFVVVGQHALRNALITIVTLVGNLLPRMIGGSVIIEYIFTIEGMGKLGFDAILSRDYPVIMAITTLSAVLTLLGILVSDLLYGAVDPRVRVHE